MRPCPAGLSVLRCFTAVTTNWDSVRSMPAPVDCRCRGRQTSIPTRGFATAFVRGPAPMERRLPPYSTVPALRRYHEEHASHIARRAGTMMSLPGVLRIGAAAGLVGVSCIANGIDAGSQPNDLRPRMNAMSDGRHCGARAVTGPRVSSFASISHLSACLSAFSRTR